MLFRVVWIMIIIFQVILMFLFIQVLPQAIIILTKDMGLKAQGTLRPLVILLEQVIPAVILMV